MPNAGADITWSRCQANRASMTAAPMKPAICNCMRPILSINATPISAPGMTNANDVISENVMGARPRPLAISDGLNRIPA